MQRIHYSGGMSWSRIIVFALVLAWSGIAAEAASARIHKVLPHLLDLAERHTLSPSLYERDAYQAFLRKNPDRCSAIRFDIQWKARAPKASPIRLRLELRTSKSNPVQPMVVEQTVTATRLFSRWTSIRIEGEAYRRMGDLIAWRATICQGDQPLAEQKSFLW